MRQELFVPQFEILSRDLSGGTKQNHKPLSHHSQPAGPDLNSGSPRRPHDVKLPNMYRKPFDRRQGLAPPTGLAVRCCYVGSVSHAVVNDAGGNGGQFWVCDVMWRVRRTPPVNQKQPASKSCDVVML